MRIFVTGCAGFIGFHVCRRLLGEGHTVVGFDGVTPYYDVALKRARLALLQAEPGFTFVEGMLEDSAALATALGPDPWDAVIHLAAQAGVRYALENPQSYVQSNIVGTFNLLERLRAIPTGHLLSASTSSVYGGNPDMPFREVDRTDFPVSLYAATKKSGEAMCHSYAHLFGLPITAFRFFTVYGPWGRPDMALFKFVRAIEAGEPIEVYGQGRMARDFTYIDDLVDGIVALLPLAPKAGQAGDARDSISPVAPYRAVNIAGGMPMPLMAFIEAIEKALGKTAKKTFLPMQPGDVVDTHADPALLEALTRARPHTPVEVGVARFIEWYRSYT